MSHDWTIKPQAPRYYSAADFPSQRSFGCVGCLGSIVWFGTFVIALAFLVSSRVADSGYGILWFSPFVIATFAAVGLMKLSRRAQANTDAITHNREAAAKAIKEGEESTDLARRYYHGGSSTLDALRQDVAALNQCVAAARAEYSANAFGPFWDNIELAVSHITAFQAHLHELQQYAEAYQRLLHGREHNFPTAYPVSLNDIPDLRGAVAELTATVRLGQTNYEFASIWEHRRTREVTLEGFKTLGEAIQNVGSSVNRTMKEFEERLVRTIRSFH